MINILKDNCPCCLNDRTKAEVNKPKVYMYIKLGENPKIYLCKEHFLELRNLINDFYEKNKEELIK